MELSTIRNSQANMTRAIVLASALVLAACTSTAHTAGSAASQSSPAHGDTQRMQMHDGDMQAMTPEQCQAAHQEMMAHKPSAGADHEHMMNSEGMATHRQCMLASPEMRAQMQERCLQMGEHTNAAMKQACAMMQQDAGHTPKEDEQ